MPTIDGPRLMGSDEFDEVMALLDRYFSYERGGMAARFPFVYDRARPERHGVVAVNGEIVAHAACVPEPLSIGDDATIECHGIGGVATAKPHRGNGYMSRLLEFWLERMDEAGVVLSELGGDRKRYGRFGWEHAGREVVYTITARSVSEARTENGVRVYDGEESTLRAIQRLHRRDPLRVERDIEKVRAIYGQRGLETLVCYDDTEVRAYLSLSQTDSERSIREVGGDRVGIESLITYLFERYDIETLRAAVHPTSRHSEFLGRLASGWLMRPPRALNVRDLPSLVETYMPQLDRRWTHLAPATEHEGEFTLGIQGEEGLRLEYDREEISITPFEGDPELSLDRRATARLLFGGEGRMNRLKEEYPILDALFPLDYYVWGTERV